MSDYALQAEAEMWEAVAAPAVEVCSRCGRELAGSLPSPCPRCSPEPRAGGIPGDGWKPGRTVEISD